MDPLCILNFENYEVNKCDEKSKEAREKGNLHFKKKEFNAALTFYNTAICFAETKEVKSLGYANRSAVYLELKRYEDCLKNIKWARENDYPEDKISKLNEREEICEMIIDKLGDDEKLEEYFKLSYPPNEKIPWVANCVKLRYTEKYGRGIYATKDLKAGDIISIEPVMIPFLEKEGRYRHCFNCFKSVFFNLIPCDKTAAFMFCSTSCKEQLYAKIDDLNTIITPDIRIFSEAASYLGGNKKLEMIIEQLKKNDPKKTIFDYDFRDVNDPKYKENLMMCLLSLYVDPDGIIISNDAFSRKYVSEKAMKYLFGIFILNNKPCHFSYGVNNCIEGRSITLFASLINHSCNQNANLLMVDNKLVIYIFRPIKKNEQIFISYSDSLRFNHLSEKMQMLKTHDFQCDCEICIKNLIPQQPTFDVPSMLCVRLKNVERSKEFLKKTLDLINADKALTNNLSTKSFSLFMLMSFIASIYAFP